MNSNKNAKIFLLVMSAFWLGYYGRGYDDQMVSKGKDKNTLSNKVESILISRPENGKPNRKVERFTVTNIKVSDIGNDDWYVDWDGTVYVLEKLP